MKYLLFLLLLLPGCTTNKWCENPVSPIDEEIKELQIDAWVECEVEISK